MCVQFTSRYNKYMYIIRGWGCLLKRFRYSTCIVKIVEDRKNSGWYINGCMLMHCLYIIHIFIRINFLFCFAHKWCYFICVILFIYYAYIRRAEYINNIISICHLHTHNLLIVRMKKGIKQCFLSFLCWHQYFNE